MKGVSFERAEKTIVIFIIIHEKLLILRPSLLSLRADGLGTKYCVMFLSEFMLLICVRAW
jgi:hypothetical protein